jgi:hypothetical protein
MLTYTSDSEILGINNLKIGDVVFLLNGDKTISSGAGKEMTVIEKTDNEVTFFRPYVHLADFIYTGGVIPYTGVEKFSVPLGNPCQYLLIANIYRGIP